MRKKILLVLSFLLVLTGCAKFKLNEKTNYKKFMEALEDNNYTLSVTVDEVYNDVDKNKQSRYTEYHTKDLLYITFDDNILDDEEYHENEYIYIEDDITYDITYTNKQEKDGVISAAKKESLKSAVKYSKDLLDLKYHVTLEDKTLESNFANVIKKGKKGKIALIDFEEGRSGSIRYDDNVIYITTVYDIEDGYKIVEFAFKDINNTKASLPKKVKTAAKDAEYGNYESDFVSYTLNEDKKSYTALISVPSSKTTIDVLDKVNGMTVNNVKTYIASDIEDLKELTVNVKFDKDGNYSDEKLGKVEYNFKKIIKLNATVNFAK